MVFRARVSDRGARDPDRGAREETKRGREKMSLAEKLRRKLEEKLDSAVDKLEDPFAIVLANILMYHAEQVDPNKLCKPMIESTKQAVNDMISDIESCLLQDDVAACVRDVLEEYSWLRE